MLHLIILVEGEGKGGYPFLAHLIKPADLLQPYPLSGLCQSEKEAYQLILDFMEPGQLVRKLSETLGTEEHSRKI